MHANAFNSGYCVKISWFDSLFLLVMLWYDYTNEILLLTINVYTNINIYIYSSDLAGDVYSKRTLFI